VLQSTLHQPSKNIYIVLHYSLLVQQRYDPKYRGFGQVKKIRPLFSPSFPTVRLTEGIPHWQFGPVEDSGPVGLSTPVEPRPREDPVALPL
jgi:hypothetical protein